MAYMEYFDSLPKDLKPCNEVNFDEYWGRIQITVQDYINSVNVPESTLNERKEDIETLCSTLPYQYDEELWVATKSILTNHVKQIVEKFQQDGEKFQLRLYHKIWIQFRQAMRDLDELYVYLNVIYKDRKKEPRDWVTGNCYLGVGNRKEVGKLGLKLWKETVMIFFLEKIFDGIFEGIHLDRTVDSGEDSTIIGEVIQSFIDVETYKEEYEKMLFYQNEYEKPFLAAGARYYQKECDRLISEGNMIEYMQKVTILREEENLLCSQFIDQSSQIELGEKFEQIFISNILPRLLEECSRIIAEERWSDLSLLYGLVKPVEGALPPVIKQFEEYMKQHEEILLQISAPGPEGPKSPEEFVNRIMAFHAKNYEFIGQVFHGDGKFLTVLDQTCAAVINHKPNPDTNCPSLDLLLNYCEDVLIKSSRVISESDFEDKLSKAATIFKNIRDKDIFQKLYERSLAKRLLLQQSQSLDDEEAMITGLRNAHSLYFSKNLNEMINDTIISRDLSNQFQTYRINGNIELGIEFSSHILQQNYWPFSRTMSPSFSMPQELTTITQKFEDFYKGQFRNRKLIWMHHLSQVQIQLAYLEIHYVITMPTLQMAILFLFKNAHSITGQDIQETLELDSEQFSKHVASLVKYKILKSNTETISPETILSLNMEFSYNKINFTINCPESQDDAPKKVELAKGNVNLERKHDIRLILVRIMKARKTLRRDDLIQEVLSKPGMRFEPKISLIQNCIDHLIEQDYIEPNPNSEELNYIP